MKRRNKSNLLESIPYHQLDDFERATLKAITVKRETFIPSAENVIRSRPGKWPVEVGILMKEGMSRLQAEAEHMRRREVNDYRTYRVTPDGVTRAEVYTND